MIRIGFTGTRKGLAPAQQGMVINLLWKPEGILARFDSTNEFHHGLCVGADAFAHYEASELNYRIVGHPPLNQSQMASLPRSDFWQMRDAEEYRERNKKIVLETTVLIAAPSTKEDLDVRSGTWMTVRIARRLGRRIYIIYPDGLITEEG